MFQLLLKVMQGSYLVKVDVGTDGEAFSSGSGLYNLQSLLQVLLVYGDGLLEEGVFDGGGLWRGVLVDESLDCNHSCFGQECLEVCCHITWSLFNDELGV